MSEGDEDYIPPELLHSYTHLHSFGVVTPFTVRFISSLFLPHAGWPSFNAQPRSAAHSS